MAFMSLNDGGELCRGLGKGLRPWFLNPDLEGPGRCVHLLRHVKMSMWSWEKGLSGEQL